MPWISSFFSKPLLTPITQLLSKARSRPKKRRQLLGPRLVAGELNRAGLDGRVDALVQPELERALGALDRQLATVGFDVDACRDGNGLLSDAGHGCRWLRAIR